MIRSPAEIHDECGNLSKASLLGFLDNVGTPRCCAKLHFVVSFCDNKLKSEDGLYGRKGYL